MLNRNSFSMFALSFSLFAVGCGGAPSEANGGADQASTTKSSLVGSYKASSLSSSSPFASLTLKADGTYSAAHLCGGNGECKALLPTDTGTWTTKKSGPQLGAPAGVQEIVLKSSSSFYGTTTYFYSESAGSLSIFTSVNGTPFVYVESGAASAPDGSALVGSYKATSLTTSTPFVSLTLNSDGSYVAGHLCGGNGECKAILPADHGTWAVTTSGPQLGAPGGASQLTLTSSSIYGVEAFFYTVSNDGDLLLSTVFEGSSFDYAPAAPAASGDDAGASSGDDASVSVGEDGGTSSTDDGGSIDSSIVGSFTDSSPDSSTPFVSLTLNADGSYSAAHLCGGNGECNALLPADTGTWSTRTSGPQLGAPAGAAQLVLESTVSLYGEEDFFYSVDGSGDLLLSSVFNGTAITYTAN
jgi:hypothetical protein